MDITFRIKLEYNLYDTDRSITIRIYIRTSALEYGYDYYLEDIDRRITLRP